MMIQEKFQKNTKTMETGRCSYEKRLLPMLFIIEGGDFRICDGQSSNCRFGGCYKQEIYKKYAEEKGRRYHENSSNI